MTRKTFQAFVFLALFLVPLDILAEQGRFAVVSDTHLGAPNSFYGAFVNKVAEEGIETIIHTGDAINRPGDKSQWARFLSIGSGERVLMTPGNHDISDQSSFSTYLTLFQRPYYSVADGDTLLVFLNTEMPDNRRRVAGQQLLWLKSELDKPFRYKFVFLHEPLYPLVPYNGLDRHRAARNALHLLFVRKGVSLVVAGHEHVYQRTERDGVEYVIQGAAGGHVPWFMKRSETFCYMLAERRDNGYAFTVIDMSGKVRDHFSVESAGQGLPVRSVTWRGALLNRFHSLLASRPFRLLRAI